MREICPLHLRHLIKLSSEKYFKAKKLYLLGADSIFTEHGSGCGGENSVSLQVLYKFWRQNVIKSWMWHTKRVVTAFLTESLLVWRIKFCFNWMCLGNKTDVFDKTLNIFFVEFVANNNFCSFIFEKKNYFDF